MPCAACRWRSRVAPTWWAAFSASAPTASPRRRCCAPRWATSATITPVASTRGLANPGPPRSLYFATPSWRFLAADREPIARDTLQSLRAGVYDLALIHAGDLRGLSLEGLSQAPVIADLVLLGPSLDPS